MLIARPLIDINPPLLAALLHRRSLLNRLNPRGREVGVFECPREPTNMHSKRRLIQGDHPILPAVDYVWPYVRSPRACEHMPFRNIIVGVVVENTSLGSVLRSVRH